MKKLNGRLAKLEKEVKDVKTDVETLNEKHDSTGQEVADLRNELKEVKKSVEKASASDQGDVLSEMKDREARKLNVIINGLKESTATEKTQVQEEENVLLNGLFGNMQMNVATTTENIKFKTRLGAKQPNKQRPFLVKFRDQRTRDDVLRNARRITTSGIRIKPDLTKLQREEDEKFKKKVDEDNNDEPSDESGDFRWKVVGPPGDLRKVKTRDIQEWQQAHQRREERREQREETPRE